MLNKQYVYYLPYTERQLCYIHTEYGAQYVLLHTVVEDCQILAHRDNIRYLSLAEKVLYVPESK